MQLLGIHSLDVSDAGDTANGGDNALELLFILHLNGHVDNGAGRVVHVVGAGFETPDVGVLGGENGGELIQQPWPVVRCRYNAAIIASAI